MISRRGLFGAFASIGVGLVLPPAAAKVEVVTLSGCVEGRIIGAKLIDSHLDYETGVFRYTLKLERELKYIVLDVTVG